MSKKSEAFRQSNLIHPFYQATYKVCLGYSSGVLWEFFGNFELQMLTQSCECKMNWCNFWMKGQTRTSNQIIRSPLAKSRLKRLPIIGQELVVLIIVGLGEWKRDTRWYATLATPSDAIWALNAHGYRIQNRRKSFWNRIFWIYVP